mmetsp:Transcript_75484/g.133228  ORF Transcript_75484/g.133228 Transcript_75484/m.133228 type:complete len:84 (-) Transcript_75484:803-1054(-)
MGTLGDGGGDCGPAPGGAVLTDTLLPGRFGATIPEGSGGDKVPVPPGLVAAATKIGSGGEVVPCKGCVGEDVPRQASGGEDVL